MVAGWWIERFERRVATGERRERTLELHRYHLDRHLLPILGSRLIREITVSDVALMLDQLRANGRAEKTAAGALGTLSTVMRFAVRNDWTQENPVEKLETCERPRPVRKPQRALGQEEIARLLDACLPQYRPLLATGVFTGMRISELLGLVWDDIDLVGGCIQVRAQLSRATARKPARRVAPKTASAIRQIPLAPQLTAVLRAHRHGSAFHRSSDWVFATRNGTPLSQRNAQRSALAHAASAAGLRDAPLPLRFHHLRHTFASHLIIDLGLDVVQVSRILGHASASTTLGIYAHMFDEARHSCEIRARMARSEFAGLLDPRQGGNVIKLPAAAPTRQTTAVGTRARRPALGYLTRT